MKNCPFCKNQIADKTIKCPHCNRTLIESNFNATQSAPKNEPKARPEPAKDYKKPSGDIWSWGEVFNKTKKFLPLIGIALLIIIVLTNHSKNKSNNNNTYVPVIPPTPASEVVAPITPPKDPSTYVSLDNGTLLYKNPFYLTGDGELNISNGTSTDSIAKLISNTNNKSVYTVYIRANSNLKIKNIKDGSYQLLFNLGSDWNDLQKAFEVNSSYEKFDEYFDFATTYSNYTIFNVTLNAVTNGTAKTGPVDPQEFGNY